MRKIKTRNLLTVILSAFCAVFLCSSVIMLNGISNKNADAQTSAYTVTVDEIYKGNGKTTVSATESVFDGINMQKLYAQITGDANADYSTVAALASGDVTATTLSANAKKINSSYNDIIVKFAGLDWTATLLTTDSNQNVVLTLWLASHYISGDPLVDQWNTQASNTNGPYPNGMYGTSYIRAAVLNNGGNYAATYNATTLTDVAQDADNTFARFTMNSVTDNVTQFLVKPANVASSSKSSVHRNDVGIPYFGNSSDANVIATYTRWLEDLLWLPSSTEVLSGNLWQTTATQRTNTSTGVWTRSAGSGHYYYARVLTASGTDAYYTTNSRYGIRPALYLNLTLAEGNASEAIRVPTVDKTEVTYDPSATQSFTLDYDDTKVSLKSLTAKTTSGVDIASSTYSFNQCVLNAKEAGTYTMTFEIVQPSNPDQLYEWQDSETNSDDTRTVTVTIKRKEYGVPTINNSTQPYKGADYLFDIDSHFDPGTMEIARPNGITGAGGVYSDGLSYDSTNKQFTAKNAGTYNVIFKLKDTANTIWSVNGGTTVNDQTVPITINKKALTFTYTPTNANMEWGLGDSGSVTLTTPTVCTGDSVGLYLYYVNASGNEYRQGIAGNVLDVSKITSTGEYTLCAKLITDKTDTGYSADNENYTISENDGVYKLPANIVINAAGVNASSLNWQYRQTDEIATKDLIVGGQQVPLQYTSDKQYFVTALGNDYMEIYSTYSNDGYVNGFKTVDANGKVVTNGCSAVGKYTTYVAIHITNPDYAFKPENMLDTDDKYGWLSYEWEISPRELDFADAKWEYSYDRNNWYDFDADGDPEYTMLGVYVRLSDAYLRSLGLNANSADSVEIIYNDGNRDYNTGYAPFNKKGSNTITAELTINDSNYTISNNTASKTFEITAKQIKIKWSSSALEFETKDTTSYTWGVTITNTDGVDYSDYIEYTFVFNDKDGNELRLSLDEAREYFKTNASSAAEDLINGTVYVSVKADSASDYIITGADLSHSFSVGEGKDTIKVEIEGSGSEYKKVGFSITATFGSSSFTQYLDVEIYSPDSELLNTFKASNASAIREYLNTLDAGNYTFGIVAPDDIAAIYAVRPDVFTFEIAKQNVEAPTVVNSDQIIYKAAEYSITDYLSGFDSLLMELDELHSETTGKTAKDYTLTINLLDKNNYKFVYPETSATPAKIQVRTALTDGETGSTNMSIASDGSYVDIIWTIQKFVITDSMFSTTTGELKLPGQFNDLLANDLLQVGYQYYADKTSNEPITELKAGETYYVVASLGGESANNFVFENPSLTSETTSQRVTFKSPQSGFSAVLGNLKNFTTKTWLGLPIWAWLLIGLFLLILLIIIIAVACKRRKSKEERAEAKARKEEEKARREEERQLQREKLEAERELAKAKQEAELEKIRMQAGMGMAGVGMASMAMQQPVQQAPAQQPAQQPQMQSQSVQQMPMQMPMQQPVQAAQTSGGMNASEMMAMMFAQLAGMKADNADKEIAALKSDKEITALKTEIEIMKLKMEQLKESKSVQSVDGKPELTPEFLGAVIASAMRSNGVLPQTALVAELPQQISENASVNCEYPPDAVITTTTTVDTTTKPQPRRTERGAKDEFMDVDGFYDKFE